MKTMSWLIQAAKRGFGRRKGGTPAQKTVEVSLGALAKQVGLDMEQVGMLPEIRPGEGRRKVLTVDDDPLVRETVAGMIEGLGWETIQAENGEVGLLKFVRHQAEIGVVLTDMNMPPGMNGPEFCRNIHEKAPDIPVIATSGGSYSVDVLSCLGFYDFLAKPLKRDRVERVLASAIGNSEWQTAA